MDSSIHCIYSGESRPSKQMDDPRKLIRLPNIIFNAAAVVIALADLSMERQAGERFKAGLNAEFCVILLIFSHTSPQTRNSPTVRCIYLTTEPSFSSLEA